MDKLGTRNAIVYGGMCTDASISRAHFVVTALLDVDDQSLAESIESRKVSPHLHMKHADERNVAARARACMTS